MTKDKKPPISINDIGHEEKQLPERGSLSYAGGNKEPPNGGGGGGSGPVKAKPKLNYTQLLISVGMAVLLVLVLGNFVYSSKQDSLTLLDNQRLLEGQIEGVSGSVSQVQSKVNTEVGRIDALTSNQANFAQKSDLNSISTSLSGLDSRISSLVETIGGLDSEVEGLEARVGALEEGDTGGSDVLEYYLVGSNQLYVRAAKAGVYVARITLVYATPWMVVGATINDATQAFYGEVGDSRAFVGTLKYSGGSWEVVSISFYTGSFNLIEGQEKTFNVPFSGPPSGYTMYAEVLPGVVSTVADDESSI